MTAEARTHKFSMFYVFNQSFMFSLDANYFQLCLLGNQETLWNNQNYDLL